MPRKIISHHAILRPILAVLIMSVGVGCLKLRVEVPQYLNRGQIAILYCHFDLEGDSLYSVKWYKDNEEFYRFVPKFHPQQQSYKVEGVKVDHVSSNATRVALKHVTLKSTGGYKCEVNAEAPSFASAESEGRMEVVYLPTSGPNISGEEKNVSNRG